MRTGAGAVDRQELWNNHRPVVEYGYCRLFNKCYALATMTCISRGSISATGRSVTKTGHNRFPFEKIVATYSKVSSEVTLCPFVVTIGGGASPEMLACPRVPRRPSGR